jgi:hypothetical protein
MPLRVDIQQGGDTEYWKGTHMASKIVPLILGSALALSVSGMALAQGSNAQNNKPLQPMTDENANSANTTQQPTGQKAAPANRMAPSTTTGSGAKSDLGANPKGSAGAERPIKPQTDESKNSADPQR